MAKKNINFKFDFMPLGQAFKRGRKAKDLTREKLAEIIGCAPRHLQAVENEGQVPSVERLIHLATLLDVSIDQYIFKDKQTAVSSIRRRVNTLLDGLTDKELVIIEGVAKGLYQARELPGK